MAVLKKQSLVDQIYDQIRLGIITLKMPLGSRLNVSELQEKYGVSSTPIREAINRLQKEGLVEYENNIGARVVSISEDDVKEIQELAMTLHAAAVRLAMKRGDHEVMAEAIRGEIEKYKVAKTFDERTICVHNIIGTFYVNCGNSRLDSNMGIIKGLQLILRNIYGQAMTSANGTFMADNSDDFEKIYDAVVEGNTRRIIDLLERNEKRATPVIVKELGDVQEK